MSAEATNPGAHSRRRGRPRIDLRRLGRAALLGPVPRDRLPDAIGHVADAHRAHHPDADLAVLHRAYVLAETSHRGQFRKSGEPYITHPLAVTLILAELGAETTTLTASLLHDTVEDTEVTLDQVRAEFGEEVTYLVDGVTKLEKVDYGAAAEPETFRKMLVATGDDVRVMSIKLADRLHNMRTLGVMRPEKQARIAKVTRDVLIPLAERLGVQALKSELEDLVFAILHPEEYERTRALIAANSGTVDPLTAIADSVRAVLREAGINAEVLIRPRHFVSVHRVQLKRGELRGTDFGRLLVLVAEDADCYAVLGELHTCFTPVISEFKDFIAAPKFNLYQSLHTAVVGPDGAVAEVLIRTHQMHKVAEAGVVALGNPYTAAPGDGPQQNGDEREDPTRPGWLSRLLDWQQNAPDPDTFWSSLREELAEDSEITVYGADGRTLGLAGRCELCRRRLRAVRGGGPRLHRGPCQRPPGDAEYGAERRRHRAAAARAGRVVGAVVRLARPRQDPGRADRDQRLAGRPPGGRHGSGRRAPAAGQRARRPADGGQRDDRPSGCAGTARGLLHARTAGRGHRILRARVGGDRPPPGVSGRRAHEVGGTGARGGPVGGRGGMQGDPGRRGLRPPAPFGRPHGGHRHRGRGRRLGDRGASQRATGPAHLHPPTPGRRRSARPHAGHARRAGGVRREPGAASGGRGMTGAGRPAWLTATLN